MRSPHAYFLNSEPSAGTLEACHFVQQARSTDIDDQAAMLAGCRQQPFEIRLAVLVGEEHRLPVVAALDHMLRLVGQEVAAEARHGSGLSDRAAHAEMHSDPSSSVCFSLEEQESALILE